MDHPIVPENDRAQVSFGVVVPSQPPNTNIRSRTGSYTATIVPFQRSSSSRAPIAGQGESRNHRLFVRRPSSYETTVPVSVDDLTMAAPKTKEMAGVLKAIKIGKKTTEQGDKDVTLLDTTVLLGTEKLDPNVYKSARNIEGVKVLPAAEFNCYVVLKAKRLVLTRSALEALRNVGK